MRKKDVLIALFLVFCTMTYGQTNGKQTVEKQIAIDSYHRYYNEGLAVYEKCNR